MFATNVNPSIPLSLLNQKIHLRGVSVRMRSVSAYRCKITFIKQTNERSNASRSLFPGRYSAGFMYNVCKPLIEVLSSGYGIKHFVSSCVRSRDSFRSSGKSILLLNAKNDFAARIAFFSLKFAILKNCSDMTAEMYVASFSVSPLPNLAS